jgi:hypothetical protein
MLLLIEMYCKSRNSAINVVLEKADHHILGHSLRLQRKNVETEMNTNGTI